MAEVNPLRNGWSGFTPGLIGYPSMVFLFSQRKRCGGNRCMRDAVFELPDRYKRALENGTARPSPACNRCKCSGTLTWGRRDFGDCAAESGGSMGSCYTTC